MHRNGSLNFVPERLMLFLIRIIRILRNDVTWNQTCLTRHLKVWISGNLFYDRNHRVLHYRFARLK